MSTPEDPRSISFFDCSGPFSRGVHALWFVDGEYVHLAGGGAGIQPRNQLDDQIYRIVDVRDPARPAEVGRWWIPGTLEGDSALPPLRLTFGTGYRAHNTDVFPERPDRAYIGMIDGSAYVLDISDIARPKVVMHWSPYPPFNGFMHTVLPLFGRDLLVAAEESAADDALDWPKLVWLLDVRQEDKPVPIGTLPLPSPDLCRHRGGRYGAHNLHENRPGSTSFRSEHLIFGTFFNGGLRTFDIADPLRPNEIAAFVPPAPKNSRVGAIQINDVFVDENAIVYTADRHAGGLYVLELTA